MRAVTSQPPARTQPMYRGELVYLSPTEPADIVDNGRWINDPEIGHNLGTKYPTSRDASERFAKEMLAGAGKTIYPFNIHRLSDGHRIGGIVLRDVDRENGSAELAIFVGERSELGRGYGTDALRCIEDFGFGELRLHRIELAVFDYNVRAIRAYEKAGFRTEVVLRRARFHRGVHHDVLIMAILFDEWLAQDRPRAWEDRD
jgi:RimJ/RimL family protein N-acetyltransferase